MAIFELPYVVPLLAGGWLKRLRLFYSLTGIPLPARYSFSSLISSSL